MDFQFGADVNRRNGNRIGSLQGLVYDPSTQQIVELVIDRNPITQHNVTTAIGSVASAEGDEVYVELTAEQVDGLPDFSDDRNLAPPPSPSADTGDEITDPVDVPDVAPVGAATGLESIAFTPIIEETVHVPARDVLLDGNTELWATDAHIGNLTAVRVNDQTNRPAFFVAGEGVFFTHDVIAYGEQVTTVEPGRIVLNVDRATIEAQSRE